MYRIVTWAMVLMLFSLGSMSCNQGGLENNASLIDTSDFDNSAHHWYDIYDAKNIINAAPNQPRLELDQIKEIADNILLYQKKNGGWPKNYDMRAILTREQKEIVAGTKGDLCTTFDNCTTYSHIKYLAQAYQITHDDQYKNRALAGIDFIFSAQYPNGGWPQYFPLRTNYSRLITYNDNVMAGIMGLLKDILDNKSYYSFVDAARREKARTSFDKGLDCILKSQIKENGKLTAWCQQHDENDLSPAQARAYELPSICNRESVGVVLFLMSLDHPSRDIIDSVRAAMQWFEDSKIPGIRIEVFDTPPVQFPLRTLTTDKRVVQDAHAPPIWARFYELGTHRPLFSNRQSQRLYALAQVDRERRAYGWYTYDPQKALDAYPAWQKKWKIAD